MEMRERPYSGPRNAESIREYGGVQGFAVHAAALGEAFQEGVYVQRRADHCDARIERRRSDLSRGFRVDVRNEGDVAG
jgi:hypothetical protein